MKKELPFLIFFLLPFTLFSQNAIIFDYDTAGNQKKRYLICVNCEIPEEEEETEEEEEEENTDETTKEDFLYITCYPNPAQEELHVQWENNKDVYIKSIRVFTLMGQLLDVYPNQSDQKLQIIPFRGLSSGLYQVQLQYSNGKRKTIKIIKK